MHSCLMKIRVLFRTIMSLMCFVYIGNLLEIELFSHWILEKKFSLPSLVMYFLCRCLTFSQLVISLSVINESFYNTSYLSMLVAHATISMVSVCLIFGVTLNFENISRATTTIPNIILHHQFHLSPLSPPYLNDTILCAEWLNQINPPTHHNHP